MSIIYLRYSGNSEKKNRFEGEYWILNTIRWKRIKHIILAVIMAFAQANILIIIQHE